MAKKPGPVAGSLGDTDYYYKSDGTVVDENGVPASARISAMFSPPPAAEAEAKTRTTKKLKKNNAQLAGVFGNSKYFYAPDGTVIDEAGVPAPEKFLKMFPPQEKREAIAAAMPAAPGKKKAVTAGLGIPSKVIKEFNKNITISTNLITNNQKISQAYPKMFEQLTNVVTKMTEHNEVVIRSMIENNQVFQDKVIETLTGVKTPTQAAGAVQGKRLSSRKVARAGRTSAVLARAQRMKASSTSSIIRTGLIAGAVGAVAGTVSNMLPGGGGAAPGPISDYNGPGVAATGSAREAISFFESKGWTKAQAIGIAANIEAESKFKTNAVGDGGKAYGIAQWHPDRQAKFQQVYGKNIREANFQEQLEYINWELNNTEKKAGAMIRQTQSAAQAAAVVDQYYERSSGAHRQIRINIAQKYEKGEGLAGKTQQTTPTSPTAPPGTPARRPSATPEEAAAHVTNMNQLKEINEILRRKGPGARLGEANAEKKAELERKIQEFQQKFSILPMQEAGTVTPLSAGNLPSDDIVAAGRALQAMGINVSEHPAFGSVGRHAPNSAHYSGRAIDVNGPPGVVEANDPVWGPKFDQIANSLRAAGYKVLWRTAGHDNHLHAELTSGSPSGAGAYAATPQMSAMSQGYAMNRVAAACECGPPVIINRTVTNDITRNISQSRSSQFTPDYIPAAYAIGAGIGSLIRKLF